MKTPAVKLILKEAMMFGPMRYMPSVHQSYHNARAMVVFKAKKLLPNMSKDFLPMLATDNVINKFVHCCKKTAT